MAKIFFLQNIEFEYLGPMYISASVKSHGHQCRVIIGNTCKDFFDIIEKEKPEVIAFSVMTGSHPWAVKISGEIKKRYPVISFFGGPHPTFFPDIIEDPNVDIICRGEGEGACVDLLNCIDKAESLTGIPNLWVKDGEKIHKNDVRPLVEDLDTIPFPDRELYHHIKRLADESVKRFITSRGCPFNCSYCFNHKMKDLYRGKGKWVRQRDADAIIEELIDVKSKFTVKTVYFCDDTFVLKNTWTVKFLEKYRDKVKIPFFCLIRADQMDDKLVNALKEAGCTSVFFGIETGNEELRKKLLHKSVSNAQLEKAANLLHKYKIKFRTYNMIGLPGESLENAFETLKFNIRIKTDFPWCSLYAPYPGTDLAAQAIKTGMVKENFTMEDIGESFHQNSVIKHSNINQLINLHKFFQTAVKFPCSLPIIKRLVKLPNNVFFNLWFGAVYFWLYVRAERREILKTAVFAIKSASIFVFWKRSRS